MNLNVKKDKLLGSSNGFILIGEFGVSPQKTKKKCCKKYKKGSPCKKCPKHG